MRCLSYFNVIRCWIATQDVLTLTRLFCDYGRCQPPRTVRLGGLGGGVGERGLTVQKPLGSNQPTGSSRGNVVESGEHPITTSRSGMTHNSKSIRVAGSTSHLDSVRVINSAKFEPDHRRYSESSEGIIHEYRTISKNLERLRSEA
ncbi:hypothetical protein PM082_024376 [Marasmius tenuissimus]|nr:hypothetical protein PM082_024376 [Marasmius tenuissimus]